MATNSVPGELDRYAGRARELDQGGGVDAASQIGNGTGVHVVPRLSCGTAAGLARLPTIRVLVISLRSGCPDDPAATPACSSQFALGSNSGAQSMPPLFERKTPPAGPYPAPALSRPHTTCELVGGPRSC